MHSKPVKPVFQSVVDLGLRDVGVKTQPRKIAKYFGKRTAQLVPLAFVFAIALCALAGATGSLGVVLFMLAWVAVVVKLAIRINRKAPVMAVKVSAGGSNQAVWLLIAPFVLLSLLALISPNVMTIPILVLNVAVAVFVVRARDRVPEVLRRFKPLLAADEVVLGDAMGMLPRSRRWDAGFRLVVATDRRLLVAPSPHSREPFPLVDVPYERVSRFGFEWKFGGQYGELSLTVDGTETHVATMIAPANLLSVALALQAHGVPADDPAALADAERAWEEKLGPTSEPRKPVLDRAAMDTLAYDRGAWLLLGLAAFAFYLNPFGVGLGTSRDPDVLLLLVPLLCGVCGYVSGTRSSLAYVGPLNLLAVPAFFFIPPIYVITMMVMISLGAAVGLWVGSALRGAMGGPPQRDERRPAPGSLRHSLSGQRLVKLMGVMAATFMVLVGTAAAAGLEPIMLRLAIDEKTGKRLPVDGRSDLTGGAASLRYTPDKDLRELVTDQITVGSESDGARWELRSRYIEGMNVVSLASYVKKPRLDNPAAVAAFVERKDLEHARLAGEEVTHTERVVDGRKGYVWDHGSAHGSWYYAAWFPQPVHTVRVECIASRQKKKFRRLCEQAMRSLDFRR